MAICKIKGCNNIIKTSGLVCKAHQQRMYRHGSYEISPKWNNLKKGTPLLTKEGYLRINIDGKRILYHRYLMEKFLNRKIKRNEVVHHKNGIRTDNRIDNLEIISQSKHISLYHPKKPIVDWTNIRILPPKIKRYEKIIHKKCLVPDCPLLSKNRGLCSKHYFSFWHNSS